MTRKAPPVKRSLKSKPSNPFRVSSLAARMAKVKLPDWTYYVDNEDRIHLLSNLTMVESTGRSCQCKNMIRGETYVEYSNNVRHTNIYEVAIDKCFETLAGAIAELDRRNRQREFDKFKSKYTGYNASRSTRIYLVREYPELVREQLVDVEMEIEPETLPKGAPPKASHFQKCASGTMFERIFEKVCALKFPDLNPSDDDEE